MFKKISMLMVLTAQGFCSQNPFQNLPVITSTIETQVTTSASSSLPATLTTPLWPMSGVAVLLSATGAYAYTTSATSTAAVTATTGARVDIGLRDGVWSPSDIGKFRFIGNWYFRLGYR